MLLCLPDLLVCLLGIPSKRCRFTFRNDFISREQDAEFFANRIVFVFKRFVVFIAALILQTYPSHIASLQEVLERTHLAVVGLSLRGPQAVRDLLCDICVQTFVRHHFDFFVIF